MGVGVSVGKGGFILRDTWGGGGAARGGGGGGGGGSPRAVKYIDPLHIPSTYFNLKVSRVGSGGAIVPDAEAVGK